MPDTGFMSPDNVVANANTFFNTAWLVEASGIIVFLATTGTQTVDGFENDGTLPAGATITGAEVLLTNTYVTSGTGTFDIQISINGGSSFSTSITSGTINTTQTNDFTLGGSSNLWGLNWSSFSDLSQLQVKGLNPTTNIYAEHVQLKLHYTPGSAPTRLTLSGGSITLNGGSLTIK